MHFHALGDRAVRNALNAIEAARRPTASRAIGTTSRTFRSFTRTTSRGSPALGATANIQPLWATHEPQMDELTIPFLGERRAGWQYPFAVAARRPGAALCAGSDWPVSSPDPARSGRTWPSTGACRAKRAATARPVPARAGDRPGHRARRLHRGQRPGQRPREHGRRLHQGPAYDADFADRRRRPRRDPVRARSARRPSARPGSAARSRTNRKEEPMTPKTTPARAAAAPSPCPSCSSSRCWPPPAAGR